MHVRLMFKFTLKLSKVSEIVLNVSEVISTCVNIAIYRNKKTRTKIQNEPAHEIMVLIT